MTSKELAETLDSDIKTTSGWLLWAYAAGFSAILLRFGVLLLFGGWFRGGWHITGLAFVSTLWSLAWIAAGFLLGFIFGVPKVQTADPSSPGAKAPPLKVNTNLEDISDWLTKILVGATLTQLVKIPEGISKAAHFMSAGDTNSSADSFNAAVLVYFLALGFLAGYLMTRMFFAVAFARADGAPDGWSQILGPLANAPVALGDGGGAKDPTVQTAAVASKSVPLTQSLSTPQAVALAVGASLAGDPDRALQASTIAVQQSPNDPGAQYSYAVALHSMGARPDRTLSTMESAAAKTTSASDPALLASIYTSLTYLYLYEGPPKGFDQAINAAAEYDSKGGPANAGIEINRACAYGQKVAFLKQREGNPLEIGAARDLALAAAKKAIATDSSSIARLKQLLWVTGDPGDDDLAVFQSDGEFVALLPRS